MIPRDTNEFFALKQAIDDQIARLGWTNERCIVYTKDRYGVRSRSSMTNDQLKHLLQTLSSMKIHATSEKLSSRVDRRRRRRRE
jgi:hypothetical protein